LKQIFVLKTKFIGKGNWLLKLIKDIYVYHDGKDHYHKLKLNKNSLNIFMVLQ